MSFGAEMKDFIAAFQVGSQIQDKRRQQALEVEQESNRSKEASNKAAAVESRYQRTLDYNQAGRDETNKRNAGIDLRSQQDLELRMTAEERLRMKEADDAWAAQIKANPRLGYDADNNPIPPPSQRGQPQEAIPTGPPSPSSGATDDGVEINHAIAADSNAGGLKELAKQLKSERGVEDVMGGAGAPSMQTMQQVFDIVDPERIMSEGKRVTAAKEALYEWYMTVYEGEDKIQRSNEAAAAVIQYARSQAAILATAAQTKMDKGDMVGAAKELIKAHDIIPDGRSTTYDEANNTFTVTDDETGDVVQEGEVTPEFLDQIAAGFTKGPLVFEMILQSAMKSPNFNPGAGKSEGKEKAEKPVTSKPLEEKEALAAAEHRDEIFAEVQNLVSGKMVDADGAPVFANSEEFLAMVGEDSADALADLAVMISGYNDIKPKDAAKMALIIVDPDDESETFEDQSYSFVLPKTINEANKKAGVDIAVIRLPNGMELELPANTSKTLILTANRGLYNFARSTTKKNTGMREERAINRDAQWGNDLEQDQLRQQEQLKTNRTGGRSGGVSLPGSVKKRTGRGG